MVAETNERNAEASVVAIPLLCLTGCKISIAREPALKRRLAPRRNLHLDICGVGGDRGATVRVLSGTPSVAEGSAPIARKVTYPLPVKRRRKQIVELEAACVTVALREVIFNQNLAQTRLHLGDELLFRGRTDSRPIDLDETGKL